MKGALLRQQCACWHMLPTCPHRVSIGTAICCCTCDAEFIIHDCCIVLRRACVCTLGQGMRAAEVTQSLGDQEPLHGSGAPCCSCAACMSFTCTCKHSSRLCSGSFFSKKQSQHGDRRACLTCGSLCFWPIGAFFHTLSAPCNLDTGPGPPPSGCWPWVHCSPGRPPRRPMTW